MGNQRVVVAIDDDDGSGAEIRLHRSGLGRSKSYGYETLPVAACKGAAGAKLLEGALRQRDRGKR